MDNVSKEIRSRYMAAIRSKNNTSTELKMLDILRAKRLSGWRRHYKIDGTPDFCWPQKKVALFVDGCFWHGCPFCYKLPKSNVEFWLLKVQGNRRRDRRVSSRLRHQGWKVLRVWECKILEPRTINRISSYL